MQATQIRARSKGFRVEKKVNAKAMRWKHGSEDLRNNKEASVAEAKEARQLMMGDQ